MAEKPVAVNQVAQDGRYTLPEQIREQLAGEYLAAYVEDDHIRLEPVRGEDG